MATESNSRSTATETSDEESLEGIGVLIESHRSSRTEIFEWTDVRVLLNVSDNDESSESGHRLSLAAKQLCDYIQAHRSTLGDPVTMLELGAGHALPSLACLQLYCRSLSLIFVTDRDIVCLERARGNHESTLESLLDNSLNEEEMFDAINLIGSIPVEFVEHDWGSSSLQEVIYDHLVDHAVSTSKMDLVLASDVVTDEDVVESLLTSAATVLRPHSGRFLLATCSSWSAAVEDEVDRVCEALQLKRIDRVNQKDSRIVEIRLGETPEETEDDI